MNTIKKNIFPILVLLIALSIIAYFLLGNKSLDGVRQDLKPAKTIISTDPVLENSGKINKVCYLKKNQQDNDAELSDIEYVEVNYSETGLLTGFSSTIKSGKILEKGVFTGAIKGDFMSAVRRINNNDGELLEQINFKILDNEIVLGKGGERIFNEDGVSVYKNIESLVFSEENKIPTVDCATVDKKEVGLK